MTCGWRHMQAFAGAWALIACASVQTAVLASGADDGAADAFRRAAGKVAASVVTIETVGGAQPADGQRRGPSFVVADGPATGLVWSADGLILTSSFNFVRDPSVISVVLPDGRRFVAELLARDEIRRLAMLKIAADRLSVPQWAPLDDMKPGPSAWAAGTAS